jgi:hypothetical protein
MVTQASDLDRSVRHEGYSMKKKTWRLPGRALAVAALALSSAHAAWAQVPNDATDGLPLVEQPDGTREPPPSPDRPTLRLEWQRQAWGVVSPGFRANTLNEARKHNNIKNLRGPKWVNIGPTGARFAQNGSFTGFITDSGRARTILPHPVNPETVYFLTSGGGLWRTNDWSAQKPQWKVLTDDLPTTGGGAVDFGRDPNHLYLGLGDPYDQILVGGAVAKSRNGGNTWSAPIELGTAVSVRDLKVDTSTDIDIVLVATDSGLYRSANAGQSYAAVAGFEGLSVWSIVRTSAGWLVSAQTCAAASAGLRCAGATTLYLSTDRGASWAPISNAGGVFAANGRTTLGVGLPGDSVVYAYSSTVGDAQMKDVYRSADGGQTWVANGVNAGKVPTNANPSMPNMNICQSQCWYNQMVLVDPRDPSRNTVWIGGNLASARSINGGGTWSLMTWWLPGQVPLPYAHADFHSAAFKTTGTPTLILGNDGGLADSVDGGATFGTDKNNGLVSHLFYTIGGNRRFPNVVIGGTQDNGTRLRIDNSGNFNQVIGGDGMGTAYSVANTNTVIGSAQGSSMRTNLSNNPPIVFQNWAAATAGLSDAAGFGFFTAITPAPGNLDPNGRTFFHFSNSRVWRTDNGGLTWTRIASATTPTSPGLPATRRFRSANANLGVSPQDLNRIAVGAAGGFLDITTDGGANWTDIDLITKVPGYQGFVTNVTWQDNKNLWITSVAQAAGSVRVIKASIANAGDSWTTATFTPRQSGLPDVPVTRVYIDPRDPAGNVVYAATHVGIYVTYNGGGSWQPYGVGLPTVRVNDIYMPPDGGFIRIATYGRGIWELPQIELVGTSLSDDIASCDRDGVLDNGETASLRVTLANQGPNNLNQVTMTVTSSNPNVSFPNGNTVSFPPLQKFGSSTGTIAVALNGATTAEAADFQIAIVAPEMGQPTPILLTSSHRLNYDERVASSITESADSANNGWTVGGDAATQANILNWQRRALSPTRNVWWGPDNNGQFDGVRPDGPDQQTLTSPVLRVGSAPLVISFQHRFSFEATGWDGGVVELSADGGNTWADIGTSAYNGTTNGVTIAPIGANRPAFVNRMVGWPGFAPVTLNLGTAYAGRDVRLRFRIGADESTGAPGWEITDINVSGLTNTPFSALQPHAAICVAR